MTNATGKQGVGEGRVFLFLQGPHGPFFAELSERLIATGARCWRVAWNAGDTWWWPEKTTLLRVNGASSNWPNQLADWVAHTKATDIVLYGDTRQHHADAVRMARGLGLQIHIFEEGYLRPYWATYERDGANGNSRLMEISVNEMSAALSTTPQQPLPPPDRWGDLRHHMWHGAIYHWHVLFRNHAFPNYQPHRNHTVRQEFALHLLRLLRRPRHIVERWLATRHVLKDAWPYHVVLLQLEHDASFRAFSRFASQTEFVALVLDAFAANAPSHHRLVFKAHPLEDGRAAIDDVLQERAIALGVQDRVSLIRGGKLAHLLQAARSAVTVNSTAAHQALWRGLPVRSFGTSVYGKRELVSHQPLAEFFTNPMPPDPESYNTYRQFLMETSQLPGGFYSAKGRAQLLRHVVDRMFAEQDPYTARLAPRETQSQQLRVVR